MLDSRKRQHILQLNRRQVKGLFQGLEYLDDEQPKQRSTAEILEQLTSPQRDFVRHWLAIIERSDKEVAKLFMQRVPQALRGMDLAGVEAWLLKALEQFDQRGLGWAVAVLNDVDRHIDDYATRHSTLKLTDIGGLLQHLVTGLGGRELRIAAANTPYTDTETLYLPAHLEADSREHALSRYKALAVHHWAQTWYGTWRPAVLERLARLAAPASAAFAALERLRLDACIARDFPGAYRAMQTLHANDWPEPWRTAAADLHCALDSCRLAVALQLHAPPPLACYHGAFFPDGVKRVLDARLQRERRTLRLMLGRLQQDLERQRDKTDSDSDPGTSRLLRARKPSEGFSLARQPGAESSGVKLRLLFDQRPLTPPDDMQNLVGSIVQDLGEVPEDYFRPGGQKPYDAEAVCADGRDPYTAPAIYADTDREVLRYPEWDYRRQRYRPRYCALREYEIAPSDAGFVAETREKYHGLIKTVRRSFELLLNDSRLDRRQANGDDIDLDALVAASADAHHGAELREDIYTRLNRSQRSIAVLFMVDMSGSTKGWVNQAEREALVLLCEALETIGDRYAIYGFSGRTHLRVDIYRVKRFEDAYDEDIRARIGAIEPRAYTRMGAPIRHLAGLLKRSPARHKLLIALSDGKPEDHGSYYGRYGIEDTRQALLESRRDGVHPFCITIDRQGGDYLPHMYGPANYVCIDEVRELPLKVADIYRRLTT